MRMRTVALSGVINTNIVKHLTDEDLQDVHEILKSRSLSSHALLVKYNFSKLSRMLMKNLMWWNVAILTAEQSNNPWKTLPFDIMMQLCNMALSILLYAAHQKFKITIKMKWFLNNHNKRRFTQHYLSRMENPLQESSSIMMKWQAAFWSCVSCRACDKMRCEQGSLHQASWAARYRTTSLIAELGLSSCHVQILL